MYAASNYQMLSLLTWNAFATQTDNKCNLSLVLVFTTPIHSLKPPGLVNTAQSVLHLQKCKSCMWPTIQ